VVPCVEEEEEKKEECSERFDLVNSFENVRAIRAMVRQDWNEPVFYIRNKNTTCK
jgi:hypothetical protein